jgi:hypothetical protein
MRRDQHVRGIPKWIIFGEWLRIRHIQCGTTNLFGIQSFDESCLVDDLAPCDVSDVSATGVSGVENFEFRSGEEVSRCFAVEC